MTPRSRTTALALLMSALLALVGLAGAQSASAAPVICEQYGSTTIQGGRYVVMNNRWGISATQCIDVSANGFTVTQADGQVATNGAPKSYPGVYYGCHYGNCSTSGNILSPNGLQASDPRFSSISTSVSMTFPSSGTYDAAYDIWFNKSRPSTTTQQNDGAEVMVWLNHAGSIQPIGSKVATATIAGAAWDVWYGTAGWNVISYVRQSPTSSISFPVSAFWSDVVSRGYGSNSWYLTSIQAGFEPWIGGTGLAVTNFSVTTDGSTNPPSPTPTPTPTTPRPTPTVTPTPTPTPTPTTPRPTVTPTPTPTVTTPPPSGGGACTATLKVDSSWPGGFQATVTVKNGGSSAGSGWTVKGTLAGGTSISSLWNGVSTTSGTALTVKNAPYNGSLPAGGSTTFGLVANGTAPTGALTCTIP